MPPIEPPQILDIRPVCPSCPAPKPTSLCDYGASGVKLKMQMQPSDHAFTMTQTIECGRRLLDDQPVVTYEPCLRWKVDGRTESLARSMDSPGAQNPCLPLPEPGVGVMLFVGFVGLALLGRIRARCR